MSYYRVCPHCGAALDPGERCDCQDEKKAAVSAANADNGTAEIGLHTQSSASHDTKIFRRFQDER